MDNLPEIEPNERKTLATPNKEITGRSHIYQGVQNGLETRRRAEQVRDRRKDTRNQDRHHWSSITDSSPSKRPKEPIVALRQTLAKAVQRPGRDIQTSVGRGPGGEHIASINQTGKNLEAGVLNSNHERGRRSCLSALGVAGLQEHLVRPGHAERHEHNATAVQTGRDKPGVFCRKRKISLRIFGFSGGHCDDFDANVSKAGGCKRFPGYGMSLSAKNINRGCACAHQTARKLARDPVTSGCPSRYGGMV